MKLEEFYRCLDNDPDFIPDYRRRAIMVLDTSGFTHSVEQGGIINALRRVREIHAVAKAAIEDANGTLLKKDADNIFAHFEYVKFAKKAADQIHANLSQKKNLAVSIGIGYGELILLDDDAFGLEFNYASKLGEDLAKAGETKFTQAAHNRLNKD